jgi:glycosyltransferase involved in cell wall biosynthesis
MRVLHLGKFYAPVLGGIESVNRFVIESLPEYEHHVLCFNTENRTIYDVVEGISVVRAGVVKIIASQPISYDYYKLLKQELDEFSPNVIHFHYPNPLVAAYIIKLIPDDVKLIVHWHSDIVAQRYVYGVVKPLERLLLKKADIVIATSERYANASKILNEFKAKVKIIPCAINTKRFDLTATESKEVESLKNSYKKPLIFFIARHVTYKGLRYLLEAEKNINSECYIVVAGVGPLTSSLKKEFISNRIVWLGKLSDHDMKLYYHAASIFAFPSITRNEAFGVVLAEAMYCGCPTVTFTIEGSGVNWVSLNNVTGIEVENKDVQNLAVAVDKLLTNENLLAEYSSNAHNRVQTMFSEEAVGVQVRNLYANME